MEKLGLSIETNGRIEFLQPVNVLKKLQISIYNEISLSKEYEKYLSLNKEEYYLKYVSKKNQTLLNKYNKNLFEINNDFYIKIVDEQKKYGTFSSSFILKNAYVGIYGGEVRPLYEILIEEQRQNKANRYLMSLDEQESDNEFRNKAFKFYIDAQEKGFFTRFINHSESPNCQAYLLYLEEYPVPIILALRDIEKNEEITINYGNHFAQVIEKEIVN